MTSPSTKRLLKESTDLHKNPSPYFSAAPVCDSNLHDWHFTLAGPPSPTPYAGGLYHGRITFPPTYPLRPPTFRFLTPSGRFEVNREICLSISGHHEETWQPAWGVRTALLAIRSEIMGSESKGQVGGMEGSEGLRREFARVSREWVCRECKVSNGEIMRGVWTACGEKGVDIDVEGVEEGGNVKAGEKEAVSDDGVEQRVSNEVVQDVSASISTASSAEIGASRSSIRLGPSTSQSGLDPALPAQSRSELRSAGRTAATTPDNSPWLDRAIIAIVIALIVLVLRRVTDVNDI